jgi:DNA-binding transcriptional ArsR family regulator
MVQHRAASSIDRVTAAISDPTRRAILERLSRGYARISDVAEPFSMTLTGFCKHVRLLERAGLIRHSPRPRQHSRVAPSTAARCGALDSEVRAVLERPPRSSGRILRHAKGGITMNLTDLTVSRTIPATAERVFDVWINPKSPGGPWFGADRVILNPVVDGLFYLAVKHEGRTWPHYCASSRSTGPAGSNTRGCPRRPRVPNPSSRS